MAASTLYICYFSVREPLVQTQVIPYLLELVKGGLRVSLLTFEVELKSDWTGAQIEHERARLAEKGIAWSALPYHKWPSALATAYDIVCGAWVIRRAIRREKYDVLHGRVHIPTLMAAIARTFSRHKPKVLFDIRGFFPEEYTEAGVWPEGGWLYRAAKRAERWLMKESDGFVVLTEKARDILFPESKETGLDKFNRPVEVIPCCVNLDLFKTPNGESRELARNEIGAVGRFVAVYVGSFGGRYMAHETADFYGALKRRNSDAFALVLTPTKPELVGPLLQANGYSPDDYWIGRVPLVEIPDYLGTADIAISFATPGYSKHATSPTKNAEYLACGLPIVSSDGTGDTTSQITQDATGVVIREFNTASYETALDGLDDMLREGTALKSRCRASAERRFDVVKVGGERYRRVYSRLLDEDWEESHNAGS